MYKKANISNSVIRRLPRYYRFLVDLKGSETKVISSGQLSEKMQLTASQIRQDFNCFGEFGQQGHGYSIEKLYHEISNILGFNRQYKTILVGYGNIGCAVISQIDFSQLGFKLMCIFEKREELIGQKAFGVDIKDIDVLEQACKELEPEVAILCIPKSDAVFVAQRLHDMGVKAFWNFSDLDINKLYDDVIVENVHTVDSLMTLCFRLSNKVS